MVRSELRAWLTPPRFADEDKNSIARALYSILMALLVAFVLSMILLLLTNRLTLALVVGMGGIPLGIEILLVRRAHVRSAGLLLVSTLTGLALLLMYLGDGLIDITILLIPAVLLIASMLLSKGVYVLLNGLSLLALTWIAYEQYTGIIFNRGKLPLEIFADWVVVMLILPVTALASYLLAEGVRTNLRTARENEARLRISNSELEREVADRKRAEQELATSEERYRLISGVISDYTFSTLVRPDGSLQLNWVAGAFQVITGYTYEEYIARGGWPTALHPEDVEQDARDMARLRRNEPVVTELRTIAKDGKVHWVRVYAHPLWDSDKDALRGIYGAVQDVSDRRQVEIEREKLIQELEDKNTELERFTYTVSHDLKSPLITIQGFLGYLEKDAAAGNTERLRSDIQRINSAAEKMQRLLGELLELSRIGRLMNPPVEIPFDSLVREALTLTEGRLQEGRIRVEVDSDLPTVHGDPSRLVEVLQNLIDNAAKFMGDQPDPLIHIGLTHLDGQPVFFVQDNGIGIEPRFQPKVFGLFNKLDPKTEGTGVGLALAKRIVEVHGGKIWVHSTGMDSGATFYFTLPSSPQAETPMRKPK